MVFWQGGAGEGEGNDLPFSVTLGLKWVSVIHLLLLCTRKPLFSFLCGDFSLFSFNTDKERILIYERIISFILSLKDVFLPFQETLGFCINLLYYVHVSREL